MSFLGISALKGGALRAWRLVPGPIRAPVEFVIRSIQLYMQDDCSVYAAAISYYALFSLVPLSVLTIAVFGLVVSPDRIVDFLFDQFPLEETADQRDRVSGIVERSRNLGGAGAAVALPVLLWTGSGLFSAVRRGLNATEHFRVPRPIWHAKLVDFAMMPSLGLLVLASIALTATAQVVLRRAGDLGPVQLDMSGPVQIATYALPALVSFTLFFLIYRFVPNARPGWWEAITSAALATVLFEGLKLGGTTVIEQMGFARDTGIYAGVGAVFVFLFWMYLNATILLYAAEFAQAIFEPTPEIARQRMEERQQSGGMRPRLRGLLRRSKGVHDA